METKQSKMISGIKELISPWYVIFALFLGFLCHGSMLFSDAIGIDTEKAIQNADAYAIQGRAGVLWIRNLLTAGNFNLYYMEALTFALLVLSPFVFLWLIYAVTRDGKTVKRAAIPFLAIWIVSPFWVAQLYFLSQSVPVLVTLILLPVAAYLTDMAANNLKKSWWGICVAVAVIYLSLNVYQLQIVLYALCVLVIYYLNNRNAAKTVKENTGWILINVVTIILGMALYFIITKLFFFDGQSYFTSQISWFSVGIVRGIRGILSWTKFSLLTPSFSKLYMPGCILLLLLSAINLFRDKERRIGNKIFLLFVEVLIGIIPYVFVIFYGGGITPRMCYPFPVTEAVVLLLLISEAGVFFEHLRTGEKKGLKVLKTVAILLAVVFLIKDVLSLLNVSNKLYYTQHYVYQQDVEIAKKVKEDLERYISENGYNPQEAYEHLVFLGTPQIAYNESCWPDRGGATIGGSFWEWDNTASMYRQRIYSVMDLTGNGIQKAYFSPMQEYVYYYYFEEYFGETVSQMAFYPSDGYIKYLQDEGTGLQYLVVKLGYDWRDELDLNRDWVISQEQNW